MLKIFKKKKNYTEALKLPEEAFKKWLMSRVYDDRRELLVEMAEHEYRTNSFKNSAKGKELSRSEQTIIDVFDFEKGPDIVNTFHKVTNVLGNESKEVPPDLTAEAIYAKAATDFVGLKNGQQKF